MVVILKIPLFAALYLVWWAVREEPAVEEGPSEGDRRPRRGPPALPRFPRRGPAGGGAACRAAPCSQSGKRAIRAQALTARRR
jgi:hypothetical protein